MFMVYFFAVVVMAWKLNVGIMGLVAAAVAVYFEFWPKKTLRD